MVNLSHVHYKATPSCVSVCWCPVQSVQPHRIPLALPYIHSNPKNNNHTTPLPHLSTHKQTNNQQHVKPAPSITTNIICNEFCTFGIS